MKNVIPTPKITVPLLIINLALIALIVLLQNNLPPTIPLLYGEPRGEEQLVPRLALTIPPVVSISTIILNSIFAYFLKDKFLKRLLMGIMVATTILSAVTVIKIILLIGSF